MGTSKSYSASIKGQPQWGNLSGAVTSSCDGNVVASSTLGNIISKYVSVIGGSGRAGRGASRIGGRAGLRTAKNIGAFLGAFSSSGGNISEAFTQVGLPGLENLPLNEVVDRLLEHCTGPSSTLDDVAAKAASQMILEELVGDAETIEQWQDYLKESLDSETLEEVIERYFGYYIFEHLSIMFYEKLIVDKGKSECEGLFRQIKDYIFEKIKNMNKTNPLKNINWSSEDADRLVKNIQEDVLKVFEDYED
ncbi:hypothetical protein HDE69_002011 [Pedobacter cryoconitis]|uniref:Uncharacterized protein n=1 Tax=Pedobacter cryoconitis TaxID=188932 RepID=A0A7W8YSD5_9SPHI|nr:hypothetical protein [Pedobacter cryoconitis]MBB5620958.1 hypothetical protein [Pedobacter cryoconitis]